MRVHLRGLAPAAGFVIALSLSPSLASAQAPPPGPPSGPPHEEKYTNLKILPADIPHEQLHGIMRNFSSSLGVRCNFCHVGSNPMSMEWAKDDKEEKRTARLMMKMAWSINHDTLTQVENMSKDADVGCYTCHRGAKQPPHKLSDVLAATAKEKGAGAAMDQYAKLKEESGDAGLYDFRAPMVVAAANQLREQQKGDEAVTMLKAAATLFPKSADVAVSLGQALAEKGDKAGAEAELNRALTIDPQNFMAKGTLERLKGGGAPPHP